MNSRVHETGAAPRAPHPADVDRLPGQSNTNWEAQDTSVWPMQSFEWRDLTLRRSRDTTNVRPIDFRVHYEIGPVGMHAAGRALVPQSRTPVYRDAAGKARYGALHVRWP